MKVAVMTCLFAKRDMDIDAWQRFLIYDFKLRFGLSNDNDQILIAHIIAFFGNDRGCR